MGIKMNSQEYYNWLSKFEKRTTSDDKAKEQQAKEQQAKENSMIWQLSEVEQQTINELNNAINQTP